MAGTSAFNIGDRVEAVDDTTRGVVCAVSEHSITIESTDGFKITYRPSELVRVSGQDKLQVSAAEVALAKSEEIKALAKKHSRPKRSERSVPKMEVDLHIQQLVSSTRGMSTHDILTLQLDTAKRQLDFAIRKRIRCVVFIHGVGAGVLKEELRYLFNRYDMLRFYDADYQKYGLGATEVYILQNP